MEKPGLKERSAAVICGILILLIILITATQTLCYWIPGWWRNEYAKYDTPSNVNGEMSLDDAVYITEQMLEYCIGRIDTLDDTMATIDGKEVQFFTEREKLHLSDCRNIFMAAVKVRAISIDVLIILMILTALSCRRSSWNYARLMAGGYLKSLLVIAVLAAGIIAIGMHDFTYLFTKFHHVFFDNDLWILDPRHDNLINVMQEDVFSDAAVTIGSITGGCAGLLALISAIILRRSR